MSLQQEFDEKTFRDHVDTILTAERNNAPWRNSPPDQNTHFEQCVGTPEVCVYAERYNGPSKGIEILFWADISWFDAPPKSWDDVPERLRTFAEQLVDFLENDPELSSGGFEFVQHAPPSDVLRITFFLD